MNPGTRVDHNQFCLNEEWEPVRGARGGVRHHITYELPLPDGRILRTRVSRPVRKETYGADLWKTILREQLEVTEDEFWNCVRNKVKPERGPVEEPPPENALPAQLVYLLIHQAGVPEDQVATMTLPEALEAMNAYWSAPRET